MFGAQERVDNPSMSDVMQFSALGTAWQRRTSQIAQLLQSVPIAPHAAVLMMMDAPSPAQTAMVLASARCHAQPILLDAAAPPQVVAQLMRQYQPCVVACKPAAFGWVSKLAFLSGSKAVYTCSNEQEGTLLARAAHFAGDDHQGFERLPQALHIYDAQGHKV